jgi:hypothetical protein
VAASLLLIPQLAAIGAASALAIGTAITLLSAILFSRRLTPVPIPWRELLGSTLVAVAVGVAAWLAAGLFGPDAWPIMRLAAGGGAGGVVFLALQSVLHPAPRHRRPPPLPPRPRLRRPQKTKAPP